MSISRSCLAALITLSATVAPALAQQCPKRSPTGPTIASEVRSLEGALIFHDDIRQWFDLRLDRSIGVVKQPVYLNEVVSEFLDFEQDDPGNGR